MEERGVGRLPVELLSDAALEEPRKKSESKVLPMRMARNDQESNLRKDSHPSESDRCGFLP